MFKHTQFLRIHSKILQSFVGTLLRVRKGWENTGQSPGRSQKPGHPCS